MNKSRKESSSRSKSFNGNAGSGNGWHQRGRKQARNSNQKNVAAGTQKYAQKDETTLDPRNLKEELYSPAKQQSGKVYGKHLNSGKTNENKHKQQATNNRVVENDRNVDTEAPKYTSKKTIVKKVSPSSKQVSKSRMDKQNVTKSQIPENMKANKELPKQEQKTSKNVPYPGQKRKIRAGGSENSKKSKRSTSESDSSDADSYIDQFFLDVSDDDEELENTECSSLSHASDFESVSDDDLSLEKEEGNSMSLEELMDYYGNNRDTNKKISNDVGKKKKVNNATKTANVSKKCNSSISNGWVEEENDVTLEYDDSDGFVESSDDDEELEKEVVEGDNFIEEDDISFEMDNTSDEDDYECSIDSYTGESDSELDEDDFYSSAIEESDSDSEEEDGFYFNNSSYDSEDDESYVPPEDDDLFISRGTATIYEIDDNNVSFNSDIDTAQIVELPSDSDGRVLSATTSLTGSQTEDEDKSSCPELVPIYDPEGRLIDCPEMLSKAKRKEEESPKTSSFKPPASKIESPIKENVPSPNIMPSEPLEEIELAETETFVSARNLCDLSLSQNNLNPVEATCDAEIEDEIEYADTAKSSAYKFYDAIDKRMSLLVLKGPLHFSGHLTIQPMIGSVEVMGYRLRRGECKNVYAVRGYHCLNLNPHPEEETFSSDIMEGILTRLEKHFQNIDLKELEDTFDPANSVLILLQAGCNNNRIFVAEKYLPQETLFPKLEDLRRSPVFPTECLLNAEFFTEHVDKRTSLYQCDPAWDNIEVKRNSKVVVMGGKGAGKSTLCQYLINKNVGKFKKVVLIDLDIGQPLQYIPETISVTIINKPLLGVATFEPTAPMKAWLFGSLDVVSSPIFYIQNVRQLILYCQQNKNELANIPWIVNTMGYVTGFGEEMMSAVLQMLNPTDVVQLVATNRQSAIPNFQNELSSSFVNQYNFNILRSEVQEFSQRKVSFRHHQLNVCYPRKGFTLDAPKRRNLMLLAHLANILDDCSAEWFNEVRPFCAPLSKLQVLITREDQSLSEDQLPSVLNATLVYLCRKTDGTMYECLGIGIVRGVDKKNNVYLLQSLPGEVLAEMTVLAICSSSLPNAVFLQQSARIQGSIPYVYNVE
ncbi:polynucleotide 5'-hydroxyl-kinase NOL9 [Toxorhynchites rutilus septentrionalis]|uniref:polynucleotide 5'-hydroxyl-kinase NOL9 n=1 Tax=Toxorhynchites rutilus septentrionalis TaxID=329112 RepID=UPI002479D069|nr:polynucleotide 5'-hydroxyl-kinase NOL9 [Toxorhynchites rutilus septentrionalis]